MPLSKRSVWHSNNCLQILNISVPSNVSLKLGKLGSLEVPTFDLVLVIIAPSLNLKMTSFENMSNLYKSNKSGSKYFVL